MQIFLEISRRLRMLPKFLRLKIKSSDVEVISVVLFQDRQAAYTIPRHKMMKMTMMKMKTTMKTIKTNDDLNQVASKPCALSMLECVPESNRKIFDIINKVFLTTNFFSCIGPDCPGASGRNSLRRLSGPK